MVETTRKLNTLRRVVRERNDFLAAVRSADHLPDADLDEQFLALVDEIRRRNELDEKRIDGLYDEIALMEETA